MRALVTGGAGFIGARVAEALIADGAETHVIDDLSSGRLARVPERAEFHEQDLSEASLTDLVCKIDPDQIFHLGAQSSVTVSVKDPERDCEVNVIGMLRLLEAAKIVRAPISFTSTGGALYGNSAPIPTPESFSPAPLSPYGASKWAGEAYLRTWAAASELSHTVCRLGNVYGPGQSPDGEAGVVAIFSKLLWSGEVPTLYGGGSPTRDYVYVDDVVEALRRANGAGGVYNIATGVETSTSEIFERLREISGAEVAPLMAPLREGELARSCMSPAAAREKLGWAAQTSLSEGLIVSYKKLVEEFAAELSDAKR